MEELAGLAKNKMRKYLANKYLRDIFANDNLLNEEIWVSNQS